MNKPLYYILILTLLLTACQNQSDNKPLLSKSKKKQPIFIVNPNRHLNIAEFWIDQIDSPDKIIMNQREIRRFNREVVRKGSRYAFSSINNYYSSSWIKGRVVKNFKNMKQKAKYYHDDEKIPSAFYKEIQKTMNLNGFHSKKVKTRYALTINYSDQKLIPTEESLLKKRHQIYFDRNQNSALDIGTPIAILHTSIDGDWHYGVSLNSSGWVHDSDIAFGERDEIEGYLTSKKFVITTSAKTALLFNGHYHDYFRMGVRLPLISQGESQTTILVPTRDHTGELTFTNGTINNSDVHLGYLPYTSRTILTQAFKFLHLPYGWGGMYGEQDCSKFIQEIYATTGVKLPRNSSAQSQVGTIKKELRALKKEAREKTLESWLIPGVSILHLKGHIVLYIGLYRDKPYIIQTVWGNSKRHFALGRTAVNSLDFNDYFMKIDRVTNITTH